MITDGLFATLVASARGDGRGASAVCIGTVEADHAVLDEVCIGMGAVEAVRMRMCTAYFTSILIKNSVVTLFTRLQKGDFGQVWWLEGQQTCVGTWLQGHQTCVGTGTVAPGPANLCWCIQKAKSLFW